MNNDYKKQLGQFYTPGEIVNKILDLADYRGRKIATKHVIDNSCGDGAFLYKIVKRYVLETLSWSTTDIKAGLENYIHGIEICEEERLKCINTLNVLALSYGIKDVHWDIIHADALKTDKYDGKMDYVLGNPPYGRCRSFGDSYKNVDHIELCFARGGSDVYLAFYELGLNMLSNHGKLAYITPSYMFKSDCASKLRNKIINEGILSDIVDLKHSDLFDASVYCSVVVLNKNKTDNSVFYYDENFRPEYVLKTGDYYINNQFVFCDSLGELEQFRKIVYSGDSDKFRVKYGFATTADKFFIIDNSVLYNRFCNGVDNLFLPCVKGGKGTRAKCFFPYKDGKLIPYEELIQNDQIKEYYQKNEEFLKSRPSAKKVPWWGFGKSQGIADVYKNKYSIANVINENLNLRITHCPPGTGVYGGIYIVTDFSKEQLEKMLCNRIFFNYVKNLGIYKRGGYYTFKANDLKLFLNYAVEEIL